MNPKLDYIVREIDVSVAQNTSSYTDAAIKIGIPQLHVIHNLRGQGVSIGIVDTGYAPHVSLKEPKEAKAFGFDAPLDDVGHGTGLYGIAAAIGNPLIGCCPESDFYIAKYLGKRSGNHENKAKAINWLVSKKVDVIIISSGSHAYSKVVHKAIQNAYKNNIAIFVSIGNTNGGPSTFPSYLREVVASGSVTFDELRSIFQASDNAMDFVSYGDGVLVLNNNNGFDIVDGTSFSNVYNACKAALIIQKFKIERGRSPSIYEIANLLRLYSRRIFHDNTGFGIPQPLEAIEDRLSKKDFIEMTGLSPIQNSWKICGFFNKLQDWWWLIILLATLLIGNHIKAQSPTLKDYEIDWDKVHISTGNVGFDSSEKSDSIAYGGLNWWMGDGNPCHPLTINRLEHDTIIVYRNIEYQQNIFGAIEEIAKLIRQDQVGTKPKRVAKALSELQEIVEKIRSSTILTEQDKTSLIAKIISTPF